MGAMETFVVCGVAKGYLRAVELSELQARALEREALRVYGRYQRELVEAYALCPWALKAREEGHVQVRALLSDDLASVGELVEELANLPEVHVGLIVLPLSGRGRAAHERFVAGAVRAHAQVHDGRPLLAMAAFHPDADPDLGSPARLVSFIRRSPDPTIQLVRLSILEDLRRPFDRGTGYVDTSNLAAVEALLAAPAKRPLHERIAQSNLDTVERVGVSTFEARLADIRRDRDASYAKILRRR